MGSVRGTGGLRAVRGGLGVWGGWCVLSEVWGVLRGVKGFGGSLGVLGGLGEFRGFEGLALVRRKCEGSFRQCASKVSRYFSS